jgi:drug/metabolite transporter (DMT)-like permease
MSTNAIKKPNYRGMAFVLILLCELVILATRNLDLNAVVLSALTTLILVVVLAFMFSSLLRGIKSLEIKKNFLISGVASILIGILYFLWIRTRIQDLIDWLHNYGLYILLIIIALAAAFLLLNKGAKKENSI